MIPHNLDGNMARKGGWPGSVGALHLLQLISSLSKLSLPALIAPS